MQYTQLSRRSAGSKIDWETQYLTFIPIEDAVFSWAERAVSGHLEYSVNGGQTWVTIANGESTPTITAGNKVMWRGDLNSDTSWSINGGIGTFSASGNYNAYGNTMSLLFYDNYYGSQINRDSVFVALFRGDSHIVTAPLLPATTLRPFCYGNMFQNCTSLTNAPELPSTNLTLMCYMWMFHNCISLTTAPKLPAQKLAIHCYSRMFYDCTGLTTAPELLAATTKNYCYYNMFYNCTRLNYIKCLLTSLSGDSPTGDWLKNVASTGTFVKAASMEDWTTGISGIPSGWTVVDDNS